MTTKTKKIIAGITGCAFASLSIVMPFVPTNKASADGYVNDYTGSPADTAGDLFSVPFAGWSVYAFDTYDTGEMARAGGLVDIPNGINLATHMPNGLILSTGSYAGTLNLVQAFSKGLPTDEGYAYIYNVMQRESYYPYNGNVAWGFSLYGGELENTYYYDNACFLDCVYPVTINGLLYDVDGNEHIIFTGSTPIQIPAEYIVNDTALSISNGYYLGRHIVSLIRERERLTNSTIIDDYGTFAYGYIEVQFFAPSRPTENDRVTSLVYNTDVEYKTVRYMSVRKSLYIKNHRPPIDNTDPTRSVMDVVKSFLNTEFLPNFTFGKMLLIALGCVVLGIGLKIALGG